MSELSLDDELNAQYQAFLDSYEGRSGNDGHPEKHIVAERFFFGAVPSFLVDDVVATCSYYQSVLGFDIGFVYGDPAYFGCVTRNNSFINIVRAEPPGARNSVIRAGMPGAVDAYVLVTDIEGILDEVKANGAKVTRELVAQVYGMREFDIEDCNQYRLTIAEGIFEKRI